MDDAITPHPPPDQNMEPPVSIPLQNLPQEVRTNVKNLIIVSKSNSIVEISGETGSFYHKLLVGESVRKFFPKHTIRNIVIVKRV